MDPNKQLNRMLKNILETTTVSKAPGGYDIFTQVAGVNYHTQISSELLNQPFASFMEVILEIRNQELIRELNKKFIKTERNGFIVTELVPKGKTIRIMHPEDYAKHLRKTDEYSPLHLPNPKKKLIMCSTPRRPDPLYDKCLLDKKESDNGISCLMQEITKTVAQQRADKENQKILDELDDGGFGTEEEKEGD